MMNWSLLFLIIGPLYAQAVSLGGIELRLGMTKDSALSKFALAFNVKLDKLGTDSYAVMVKKLDAWVSDGSLTFHSDKLTRIAVEDYQSQDKNAGTLAKAFYTAVASAETSGLVDVWTGRNDDATNPRYEVHLVFKDREVVIETGVFGNIEIHSVTTYFPRLPRAEKSQMQSGSSEK
jgi:hypothetical protein